MAELSVAIIGLGRLGASLGLALKRYNARSDATNHFTITGADLLTDTEQAAKKIGAVDQIVSNIPNAVRDKDLVIVASPYAETRRIFRDITPGLREGAVVMDLSPLKLPSMEWAKETFPAGTHLIGATAVLNPIYLWDGLDTTDYARADLFDNGTFLIAPAPSANRDAVELVTQMVRLLDAGTHFTDPAEHDGLVAATEGLPALVGYAVFRAISGGTSWNDIQRSTNPAFGRVTHRIMDTHPDDVRDLLLNNRDNVVRHLDTLMETLAGFREIIAANDRDALEAALTTSESKYGRWLKQRSEGKWDDMLPDPDLPRTGGFLSGMLGGFLSDRLRGKDGDK